MKRYHLKRTTYIAIGRLAMFLGGLHVVTTLAQSASALFGGQDGDVGAASIVIVGVISTVFGLLIVAAGYAMTRFPIAQLFVRRIAAEYMRGALPLVGRRP